MLHESSGGARSPRSRVLRRRIGPGFKHMDVRRLIWMREKNQERNHRRGNLPNDDGLPAPITFLKLSPSFQAQILKERSLALSSVIPQVEPAAAWRLYAQAPGLLCFWTLEVARRLRVVARITGRSYQSIAEAASKVSPVTLLMKPDKVEERCIHLACTLDPSLSLITMDTILRRVVSGPHLLTAKPRSVKDACFGLRNEVPGLSLELCFQIVAAEPAVLSLSSKSLAARILSLRHCLASLNGSSQVDYGLSEWITRHPIILSLKWEEEEEDHVSRFLDGAAAVSHLTGASPLEVISAVSTCLVSFMASSKVMVEKRVKASIDLWAEISPEAESKALLLHPLILFQDLELSRDRWDALCEACYQCTGSVSFAHQAAEMVKSCPEILICPSSRSAGHMNMELSSRLRYLAGLLSHNQPQSSPNESAKDAWKMVSQCPSLLLHNAPDPKRMAIETGLVARGRASTAMIPKRDKEEALDYGMKLGRIFPQLLAVKPGTAERGRSSLTHNEQGPASPATGSYEWGGVGRSQRSKRGILAGLPSGIVTELLSARPDLMVSPSARRALSSAMVEVGASLGGLRDNAEDCVVLITRHPWLISAGRLSFVGPETVHSVDEALGAGLLGRFRSLELLLLLAQPVFSTASTAVSSHLTVHLEALEALVSSIKTEDTWAQELHRYAELNDQSSLVKFLQQANDQFEVSSQRLSRLKALDLSSKISFLSAITMNQADFDRISSQPTASSTPSAEPEPNRRRGYINRQ